MTGFKVRWNPLLIIFLCVLRSSRGGFILLFSIMIVPVIAQDIKVNSKTIKLGNDTVQLKIYKKRGNDMVFVHVHENETAAFEAGKDILNIYGGTLVTLVHSYDGTKNRNVTFSSGNTIYQFDPNRIYSINSDVLYKTIRVVKGNGKVDESIIKMVKNLADQIWKELQDYPLITAIHNNKNTPSKVKTKWLFWHSLEDESYSINSYIKSFDQSGESNRSCSDIYINPGINNSEFFIVTEKNDFQMLAQKRYNVVLQNTEPIDDGSMSVFAQKKGIRYINAEAKMGRIKEQVQMLELLLK